MSQRNRGITVDRSLAVLGIILSLVGLFAVGTIVYGQYTQYDFGIGQVTVLGFGQSPTLITRSYTYTTTFTNTNEVDTLKATIQNQQNTIRAQNNTIQSLTQQVQNLNIIAAVHVVGTVQVTGLFNTGQSITFKSGNETFSENLFNGKFDVMLPGGVPYSVSIHYSGAFWIGHDAAPTQGVLDLEASHQLFIQQIYTVNG